MSSSACSADQDAYLRHTASDFVPLCVKLLCHRWQLLGIKHELLVLGLWIPHLKARFLLCLCSCVNSAVQHLVARPSWAHHLESFHNFDKLSRSLALTRGVGACCLAANGCLQIEAASQQHMQVYVSM